MTMATTNYILPILYLSVAVLGLRYLGQGDSVYLRGTKGSRGSYTREMIYDSYPQPNSNDDTDSTLEFVFRLSSLLFFVAFVIPSDVSYAVS